MLSCPRIKEIESKSTPFLKVILGLLFVFGISAYSLAQNFDSGWQRTIALNNFFTINTKVRGKATIYVKLEETGAERNTSFRIYINNRESQKLNDDYAEILIDPTDGSQLQVKIAVVDADQTNSLGNDRLYYRYVIEDRTPDTIAIAPTFDPIYNVQFTWRVGPNPIFQNVPVRCGLYYANFKNNKWVPLKLIHSEIISHQANETGFGHADYNNLPPAPLTATHLLVRTDIENRLNEPNKANNEAATPLPGPLVKTASAFMRRKSILVLNNAVRNFGRKAEVLFKLKIANNEYVANKTITDDNTLGDSFLQDNLTKNPTEINLATLRVPLFEKDQVIGIKAVEQSTNKVLATYAFIHNIPLILVPGLDVHGHFGDQNEKFAGPGTWGILEERLRTSYWQLSQSLNNGRGNPFGLQPLDPSGVELAVNGYGHYPTLHTLDISATGFMRSNIPFSAAAAALRKQVNALLDKTYCRRVNLIGHSKGCLISRQAIKSEPTFAKKVNLLLMAQGPHSGAPWPNGIAIGSLIPGIDIRNLSPTFPSNFTASNFAPTPGLANTANPELAELNRSKLPRGSVSGIRYLIVYSQTSKMDTILLTTYGPDASVKPLSFWTGKRDSDGIVPSFSQLGKTQIGKWKGLEWKVTGDKIIPAFEDIYSEASALRKSLTYQAKSPHTSLTLSEEFANLIWRSLLLPIGNNVQGAA